jgi:tRNA(His) guanylyltransferase
MTNSKDSLGDRIKGYEAVETDRRLDTSLPVYARIDGRTFSKFTENMERPYDQDMSMTMINVARYLVRMTRATIGYTQSDEISLVWAPNDNPKSEMLFGGKVQKLTSTLAALATAKFVQKAVYKWPIECASRLPTFDARIFNVPTLTEAMNAVLWRVNDASKNSISMAARAYFSHKELQGVNSRQKIEMLREKGIVWQDYPQFFRQGTFVKRETFETELDEWDAERIPEAHRPESNILMRSIVTEMTWPDFYTIQNKEGVLFRNEEPVERG